MGTQSTSPEGTDQPANDQNVGGLYEPIRVCLKANGDPVITTVKPIVIDRSDDPNRIRITLKAKG